MFQVEVFWVVTLYGLVVTVWTSQHYTASQPRRPGLEKSMMIEQFHPQAV
jgi:hypothetical protein